MSPLAAVILPLVGKRLGFYHSVPIPLRGILAGNRHANVGRIVGRSKLEGIMQVNMNEARSKLAELGELAWQGEEVIIAKAAKPFLRLAPYSVHGRQVDRTAEAKPRRLSGALKGHIWIAPDFDDTPEELIDRIDTR